MDNFNTWFNNLPLVQHWLIAIIGASLMLILGVSFLGCLSLRGRIDESFRLRDYLIEGAMAVGGLIVGFVIIAITLPVVFAPVWFFATVCHLSFVISCILGLPIGIFVLAKICIAVGIRN
jgi:hypothetical protein